MDNISSPSPCRWPRLVLPFYPRRSISSMSRHFLQASRRLALSLRSLISSSRPRVVSWLCYMAFYHCYSYLPAACLAAWLSPPLPKSRVSNPVLLSDHPSSVRLPGSSGPLFVLYNSLSYSRFFCSFFFTFANALRYFPILIFAHACARTYHTLVLVLRIAADMSLDGWWDRAGGRSMYRSVG
ncbi:hypothetical protein HETIRDRAFT_322676 [Heterobasidion irregulare TC 32-1]|uniref:Transmembrane protein n=1 Tax=Heterobasidion irregulare (strain TC 32-1) TaxID=747525 RepID=W4K1Y5_HETIT|nr:uncharacterized protein HETIRDRAFT_322676 [Heterobasidion irregulare TC 32-1]ETW79818.1 hypothetical protein HETIRDRAFT_322676 [Heterobasidion irregulare TC 32-1]